MTLQALLRAARYPAAAALFGLSFPVSAQDVDLDVPYVPTPVPVVEKMLDMVDVKKGERMIDLGSGDGRIAIAAAKRGAETYGVDIDPQRIAEAKANAQKAGVAERATFEERDLFDTNISQFDVITMYLLPSVNRDLRPRLLDLKPGTRIVSHAFDMGEWEPDEHAEVEGRDVFFWRVPAKVEGAWSIRHDGADLRVSLRQTFQKLDGTASADGANFPVTGQVAGENVSLVVGEGEARRVFNGRVKGDALEAVAGEGATENWTARRG
ncbi:methyltransferase domain-containing protein [Terrihabitans sp. B22-R8]|uniref:methyltransferase domain-containing protein n=1 Tax=Terrihabitans sp. B22-R8 TaxID=3425128 RepID=UPI00403D1E58